MEPSFGEDAEVVSGFDGQTVWKDSGNALLEVGNFLGGGAAGTVYECEHAVSHEHFALKILNPLGFRLVAPALLRKCVVVHKGEVYEDNEKDRKGLRKVYGGLWTAGRNSTLPPILARVRTALKT